MKRVGKIRTVNSIIPKSYEVIKVGDRLFAGKDAFLFPDNNEDLRCMECLLIPEEWEWTEHYTDDEPDYGPARTDGSGKYTVIKGAGARRQVEEILTRHETGCLTLFDHPYPYTIPINHAYRDGKLYMHCGKKGKKLSLIRRCPNACYMLYGPSEQMPANVRSCHLPYESIIFYGTLRISQDPAEKELAVQEISGQYGTPYQHGFADMVEILVFDIHHATARTGRFKPGNLREIFYFRPDTDLS